MRVKQIKWSEERQPDKECMYNHVDGDTPLGKCVISWKGWKDSPDFEIEFGVCGPGHKAHTFFVGGTLETAKASAQRRFESLVKACLECEKE